MSWPCGLAAVDGERPLSLVQVVVVAGHAAATVAGAAGEVGRSWVLHLDHLGTQVGQQHRCHRARQDARHIEHP